MFLHKSISWTNCNVSLVQFGAFDLLRFASHHAYHKQGDIMWQMIQKTLHGSLKCPLSLLHLWLASKVLTQGATLTLITKSATTIVEADSAANSSPESWPTKEYPHWVFSKPLQGNFFVDGNPAREFQAEHIFTHFVQMGLDVPSLQTFKTKRGPNNNEDKLAPHAAWERCKGTNLHNIEIYEPKPPDLSDQAM